MNVPDDRLYTASHEWIKQEGDKVRVGITDHAQAELTDVVFVELPKIDRSVNAKEAIAVVESVKAASDIYAPIKGKVVDANKALELCHCAMFSVRSCFEYMSITLFAKSRDERHRPPTAARLDSASK